MTRSLVALLVAAAAGTLPAAASASCYFVYSAKNELVYRSTISPVDLSRPISEGLRGRFAGGHMVMIPDETGCPDLLGSGFFAFTFRRGRLGNWFLASEPNHYVVAMLREAHYEYWQAYDHVVDYYLFHHLFEMLYLLDERFAAHWDATPRRFVRRATAYNKSLLEPYDDED